MSALWNRAGSVVLGMAKQPVPRLDRILELPLRSAVADGKQPVGTEHPVDAVDVLAAEDRRMERGHRTAARTCFAASSWAFAACSSAIRARMRRAARPPVSMLMLSSW